MGAFFSMIGIPDVQKSEIQELFQPFENDEGVDVGVFSSNSHSDHYLFLYNEIIFGENEIIEQVSKQCSQPLILLKFSDDVVWGYELYHAGTKVDEYSSLPNYWEACSPNKMKQLQGEPEVLATHWPKLKVPEIERYLINKETLSEEEAGSKAYPEDEFDQWDAWQVCDFMGKLGLFYPDEETENSLFESELCIQIETTDGLVRRKDQEKRAQQALEE